jgi:hypothetical protein
LTLPAAAVAAAVAWELTRVLGGGLTGPLVLFAAGTLGVIVAFARRARQRPVAVAES